MEIGNCDINYASLSRQMTFIECFKKSFSFLYPFMGCEKKYLIYKILIYKIQIKFKPEVKEISKFEVLFIYFFFFVTELQFVSLINGY